MMPLVEIAAKTDFRPPGMNPSAAVRLLVSKLVSASTRMVSSGTAIFHQVIALLVAASFFTPRKLMATMTAIRMTATKMPVALRTDVSSSIQPSAKP